MKVIGLLGPAGAGKSTVAEYLVKKYGARRHSLATPLKQIVQRAFDLSDEQLYGTQAQKEAVDPRYNVSARWLMTHIGTEGIRTTLGEDFWAEHLVRTLQTNRSNIAVIDDVRFVNESRVIRAMFNFDRFDHSQGSVLNDAIIWRLEAPWRESAADPTHQSEAEWLRAEYDYAIAPLGPSLDDLYRLVDDACRRYNLLCS